MYLYLMIARGSERALLDWTIATISAMVMRHPDRFILHINMCER